MKKGRKYPLFSRHRERRQEKRNRYSTGSRKASGMLKNRLDFIHKAKATGFFAGGLDLIQQWEQEC